MATMNLFIPILLLSGHLATITMSLETATSASPGTTQPSSLGNETTSFFDDETTSFLDDETTSFFDDETTTTAPNCTHEVLQPDDVVQHKSKLFIKAHNITISTTGPSRVYQPDLNICFSRSEALNRQVLDKCIKWLNDEDEFEVLEDGRVRLYDDILELGSFDFKGTKLVTCMDDYEEVVDNNSTKENLRVEDKGSIYMGQACSVISIVALTLHLVCFCLVPSMRNLPGYNLASLSVAFLLGYLFSLIGQIPQVLGLFCVVSGVLQQYFFLVAFFFMNSLAFDVWKTLKLATTKLIVSSHNAKRRQFIYYSLYSWGTPLLITLTSVVMDNIDAAPKWIRPNFGNNDICWMTNQKANMVFFAIPAFTLFTVNGVFFVMSAFVIRNNTMKCTSDEQKRTARNNFVLYFRLGMMMGVTWLFGVIATFSDNSVVWIIFDLMNSLQGLFVFLLFTCSKKVFHQIREKLNLDVILRTPKTSTSDLPAKTLSSSRP